MVSEFVSPIGPLLERLRRFSLDGHARTTVPVTVVPLREYRIEAAADVLASSFETETFVSTAFDTGDDRFRRAFASLAAARLRLHLEDGQPAFVAVSDDDVVGAAVVRRPSYSPSRRRVLRLVVSRLSSVLGLLSRVDVQGSYNVTRALSPPDVVPDDAYTLELIGVAPPAQGRGVGRELLEAIHGLIDRDPGASGIYLVTAEESNRRLYERFGYETMATRRAGSLRAYHMFRESASG